MRWPSGSATVNANRVTAGYCGCRCGTNKPGDLPEDVPEAVWLIVLPHNLCLLGGLFEGLKDWQARRQARFGRVSSMNTDVLGRKRHTREWMGHGPAMK
ncbi:hypothetical protein E4U55_006417 [Claviceps digitariae]|nr:hypothetical protein E4U55_006417 [Claviceps digitariae]